MHLRHTAPPNDYTAQFHDRMPVLLRPAEFGAWLSAKDSASAVALSVPYTGHDLVSWRVGPEVGNWRNEGEALIAPIDR